MLTQIETVVSQAEPESREPDPRSINTVRDRNDRIFRFGLSSTGIAVLAIMVAVGVFLGVQAFDALSETGVSFLTTTEWEPDRGRFGIGSVLLGNCNRYPHIAWHRPFHYEYRSSTFPRNFGFTR